MHAKVVVGVGKVCCLERYPRCIEGSTNHIIPLSTHNIENHTVCRGNHTCRIFMRTTSSLAGLVPTNLA